MRAVARFAHAPDHKHWKAARRISEYLKVASDYGVTFQRGSGLELVVYADAAYAPKETKKKSVSAGAVMCGGAAIQWISSCLLYTSPSPRDRQKSRMPSSA